VKIGDITSLVAEGLTNKAIAQRLGTSEQNVKNRVHKAAQKLGLSQRQDGNIRVLLARWHWEHTVKALALLLLCGVAAAQIPDAPQPHQTVCWMGCERQSPNPPTVCIGANSCGWHQMKELPPAPPTFWTFRSNWQSPPLRTNRQAFDKKFVVLHSLAAAAMIVACKRKNSGEDFGSEVPAVAAVTGLDYVMTRFFSEAMSVPAPFYMMAHYSWSTAK
jgi:hypothetical protein